MTRLGDKMKDKKKIKPKEELVKCQKCGEDENSVDLEVMPCCGALICWDFCLYEEPTECSACGHSIRVTLKDEITKEAYVEAVDASENNKIECDGKHLIIYVPISQKKKKLRELHQRLISELLGSGWIHGGDIKLKDFSGTEAEFTILKGSLK